ncbi:hypothetical protein PSTEL_00450 [Paenibacillus stellifer]|uniref:HTH cro/C1-type domain-containing protein n=1 Tax=Paenibacillus stellifer TaxID=169760 RepID=A0A089LP05_9BACL|nr:helix-turn-helix transcriptional regulator [Paenibacillus stellifer]AIQ61830.1 hypothetical protein PSTEL_00450 [Paenibacillus stellifer]
MIATEKTAETKSLREWRFLRDLPKSAVAKGIGVHPSTYDRMEKNPLSISIANAVALASFFGCEVKQIKFFE